MSEAPSIEAHVSADAGLPEREIAGAVRAYLERGRRHLAALHGTRGSGRAVNEANADLIDALVIRLFERAAGEALEEGVGRPEERRMAVVAVGGYGRRELSIHSDIDLLLLHPEGRSSWVGFVAERLQRWLWDGGLVVGSATRSVRETAALAREDHTVRTALVDGRLLAGDPELSSAALGEVRRELQACGEVAIEEHIADLRERHVKYGESLYLLQPNLKEGAGGLRDYHTAFWVACAAAPEVSALADLRTAGLLTDAEMRAYEVALDFLWRARNELHWIAGRKADQMSFELQEQVARRFGIGAEEGDVLPVERFMGAYYSHARIVRNLSELVIEQCQRRVRSSPPPPAREVEGGFRVSDGHLEIPDGQHLRSEPLRLLQAFAVAQDEDVPLSRQARRLVRENLDLVDDVFRGAPEASTSFDRILGGRERVTRTLMAMNEVGLLGAFLPEWAPIMNRWQHVIYHTYTVDVHTLFLVEELRRLWRREFEEDAPELTDLTREVQDWPLLIMGALFHDIGKGRGGDHSTIGTELVRQATGRLGWPPERQERAAFLVRHHLLMSHLAQRRDLSDPRLIVEFARTVGDRMNLRNLYLLTFADIRASSRAAWNEWKGQLLRELFERTSEYLEAGGDDPRLAFEQIEARVDLRQEAAARELASLGHSPEQARAYFEIMPRRYFVSHTPRQIVRHAMTLLAFRDERVVVTSVRAMRGDFSELIVWTRDVHGLYAKVAGVITARGLNILGSHVYTTRSGLALEVYRITTPPGGEPERREVWRGVENALHAVLSGVLGVDELLARRRRPVGRPETPSWHPPEVWITNAESDFYTIADVSANDRQGLLYDLARTITDLGLEIYISKASTSLDQVADTFYLKDERGKKILDEERLGALREALLQVVARGDGRADA